MPNEDLALLNAGLQSLTPAVQSIAQANLNKKTREWNERMMGVQRQWAQQDWELQNKYNHPSSQMARLREAGLNPNLVYGHGADAQSTSPVRSTGVQGWSPKVADVGGMQNPLLFYDLEVKQAQIDNLRVANTVAMQEALLKAAQVVTETGRGKVMSVDAKYAELLKEMSMDNLAIRTSETGARSDSILLSNQIKAIELDYARNKQELSVSKLAEELLSVRLSNEMNADKRELLKKQIESVKRDVKLKQLDIQFKRMGVQPGDPLAVRLLARVFQEIGISPAKPEEDK